MPVVGTPCSGQTLFRPPQLYAASEVALRSRLAAFTLDGSTGQFIIVWSTRSLELEVPAEPRTAPSIGYLAKAQGRCFPRHSHVREFKCEWELDRISTNHY
jgi:hypothetical protein